MSSPKAAGRVKTFPEFSAVPQQTGNQSDGRYSSSAASAAAAYSPVLLSSSTPPSSAAVSSPVTATTNHSTSTADSSTSVEALQHANKKLQQSVELLQNAFVRLGDDSQRQLETMSAQLEQLLAANATIRKENDDLKARVADDVLRQRQTNRIEMAMERAKDASRVRTAGRQRLEQMEAVLMESHDDLFHVQRFDAALAPQREVSFVFHYVSNVVFPLDGAEQFVMNVYQQILRSTAQRLRGYTISSCMGMDVFAFQSATTALEFAKDCHEQVVRLSWPEQTERVPFFATIAEFGYVLFRGPRIHSCIYTCDPECEVNAATGRTIYFGPDVKAAVSAALSLSAVGEIAVNDRCSEVLTREHLVVADGGIASVSTDRVEALRQSVGKNWDVVRLPNTHNMVASLLPLSLKGRRGVEVGQLSPTPKYPAMDGIDPQATALAVVKTMKGQKVGLVEMHGGRKRVARFVESNAEPDNTVYDSAAKLLEFYTMQRERDNVIALYRRTEQSAAALERGMMESEDRYEVSRRKPLDPSETAFVCTIDTGDDSVWAKLLSSTSMQGERDQVLSQVRSAVHTFARQYYGFLMNGNYVDIFTYVFREVEQALAFVSGVYIQINRLGTKMTGQEVFLMRAGICCGPMSTIYRNMEDGMLKCTGPVIRLSATLSDVAQNGEILAMEDVIQAFHRKNENLIDTQYNMVRQQSRFIGDYDSPSIVHSILPKPFAFRRQQLMSSTAAPAPSRPHAGRSAKAVVAVRQRQFARRDVEKLLAEQLERLERLEASRMAEEDTFEQLKTPWSAVERNPWLFTSQPQIAVVRKPKADEEPLPLPIYALYGLDGTENSNGFALGVSSGSSRRGLGLGFLFCDVVGTSWIARELEPELLHDVYQHYNRLIQDIFHEYGAYIIKTNSVTGYVAAFFPPIKALEAAVAIQQQLLAATWPEELHTLEPTLFIKDFKTGTIMFNGLRAQVAVHYSTHYKWKPLPPPPPPPSPPVAVASSAALGMSGQGKGLGKGANVGRGARGGSAAKSGGTPRGRATGDAAASADSTNSTRKRNGARGTANATAAEDSVSGGGGALPSHDDATNTVISYIEVSSTAIGELVYLGRLAHGGEIRMSLPLVDAVRRTTPGRLLLEQLTMRIVAPTTAPSALTGSDNSDAASGVKLRRNQSVVSATGENDDEETSTAPRRTRSRSHSLVRSSVSGAVEAGTAQDAASVASSVEVAVARWVVAVPRSLQGRFQFLLPHSEADERAGAAAGAASATTQAEQCTKQQQSGKGAAAADGKRKEALASQGAPPRAPRQHSNSVVSTVSNRREVPWFLQTAACTLPLPAASRGYWDQPQIVSRSGHPEAELLQNALDYVTRLFPSDLFDAGAVTRVAAAAAAAEKPLLAVTTSRSEREASSPGPTTLVVATDTTSATMKVGDAGQGGKSAAQADVSPEEAVRERKKLVEAAKYYVHWMRVARYVVESLLTGFRVGNDGLKVSKTHRADSAGGRQGGSQGGLASSPLAIDALLAMPDVEVEEDEAANSLLGAEGAVGGSAGSPVLSIEGSATDMPLVVDEKAQARARVPTPPLHTFANISTSATPLTSSLRVGTGKAVRVTAGSDSYLKALDVLDDACRTLSEETGRALGKVTASASPAVPQAPKNIVKKPTPTPPRRRF